MRNAKMLHVTAILAAVILAAAAASAEEAPRNLALNRAAYSDRSADYINTPHMATDGHLDTGWKSLGGHRKGYEQPWIYIDLGAECTVGKVVLHWDDLHPVNYQIHVSTNGVSPRTGFVEERSWKGVGGKGDCKGGVDEITLKEAVRARYVKLWVPEQPDGLPEGIGIKEFEVYGTGGPVVMPKPLPPPAEDGTWDLCAGWKLYSARYIPDDAAKISTAGYDDGDWLRATVPGTILRTYLEIGAIPDPWYADQNSMISDWFCRSDWWYRTEVEMPAAYRGKRIWLNLDGINYRADVFVNGQEVGKMAGAFIRGRFDITDQVVEGKNAIAVRIKPMDYVREPFDKRLDRVWTAESFRGNAPTFIVAAGWDWAPCMRDRNMGIWQKVFLSTSGDVDILDPYVITDLPLPDTSSADLTVKTELRNSADREAKGILRGRIGEYAFAKAVAIPAKQTITVEIDKSDAPALSVRNPKLWWPNGYGEQNLYDFSIRFETGDGKVSDEKTARVGIREWDYHKGDPLIIYCNGQKIMSKGSNWCMDEGMLRLTREDFRARLRMEKDMNFTMIRSTLGAITKPAFYEICDEYGLMIWDDFGANHEHAVLHPEMVVENARDRVRRFRNHASVVIWCGANEHGPHPSMGPGMEEAAETLDGTRWYIPNSILRPYMAGNRPYNWVPPQSRFPNAQGFKSETGLMSLPCAESIARMMPEQHLWPITQAGWGVHEWVNAGQSAGWCGQTEKAIARYGEPRNLEDFCRKAQLVSMEWAKAIFESWNNRLWDTCSGIKVWMSNPVWPCLTFGIYDYYLEPTGGYFGCRKACEPIHIQWSIHSSEVKAINNTFKPLDGVTAEATIYRLDGSEYANRTASVDCPANSATLCFVLEEADSGKTRSKEDLSQCYFIKLKLKDREGGLLSENFYWQSRSNGNYEELNRMPRFNLPATVTMDRDGDVCTIRVDMQNGDRGVALSTRIKAVDAATGLLLAPVLYSDNYFSLLPGEAKEVTLEFDEKNVEGNEVIVQIEGWNVQAAELKRLRLR